MGQAMDRNAAPVESYAHAKEARVAVERALTDLLSNHFCLTIRQGSWPDIYGFFVSAYKDEPASLVVATDLIWTERIYVLLMTFSYFLLGYNHSSSTSPTLAAFPRLNATYADEQVEGCHMVRHRTASQLLLSALAEQIAAQDNNSCVLSRCHRHLLNEIRPLIARGAVDAEGDCPAEAKDRFALYWHGLILAAQAQLTNRSGKMPSGRKSKPQNQSDATPKDTRGPRLSLVRSTM